MRIEGKRVKVPKWIHAPLCAVYVQVEAVYPVGDPDDDPSLEPEVVRYLDHLQELANAGNVEELEKHGTVYVRRSA